MAPLQPEDGHDHCPTCLGIERLKAGLSDEPYMNCSFVYVANILEQFNREVSLTPASAGVNPMAFKKCICHVTRHGPPAQVPKGISSLPKLRLIQIKLLLINLQSGN